MTRALSLRSRVPGNWQARFWRPVERGDTGFLSIYFNRI
jgi:hypothetical protein